MMLPLDKDVVLGFKILKIDKQTISFILSVLFCFFFLLEDGFAQNKKTRRRIPASENSNVKAPGANRAQIIGDPAFVYKNADFDSDIIGTAVTGNVYHVSKGVKANFRKLRLKPGLVGFISNDDIKIVSDAAAKKIKDIGKKKSSKKKKSDLSRKTVEMAKYRGPVLQYTNFAEDALGTLRTAPLIFFGGKISGYDTLLEGESYVESNILFHWGAPKYYSDVTGKSAEGWILMTDFLLQTPFPQSAKHMLFMGIGPMFRYSHFNATLRDSSNKEISYSLDEMTLGVVINAGLAYQVGSNALRLDVKYIWEKQKYFASGLAFQFPF
ncbi:MAG: SH3 domain-containing protein [Pseudobdellovibrionaceae bacterium]